MHQKFVVHLDLKPDNILIDVDQEGRPFCILSDLGISQVLTDQLLTVEQFKLSDIKGLSFAYVAPERFLSYRKVTYITDNDVILSWDLYSIGIILFQLVVGKTENFYRNSILFNKIKTIILFQ